MRATIASGVLLAGLGLCFVPAATLFAAAGGAGEGGARPGQPFDAAPFGFVLRDAQGKSRGVRWGEPRKIRRVLLEFRPDAVLPRPETVRIQYWRRAWNGGPDPSPEEIDTGSEGWIASDDWTNGQWRDADARVEARGAQWLFQFAPTGKKEFPGLAQPGVPYRKTLQIRVAGDEPLPEVKRLQAFTNCVRRAATIKILWDQPRASTPGPIADEAHRLEVFNGEVLAVRPAPGVGAVVQKDMGWVLPGAKGGIEADLLIAVDPDRSLDDRTIVTVRSQHRPFSFAVDEVLGGNRILVDDLGVLVVRKDDAISISELRRQRAQRGRKTVYERVSDAPEQTLQRAWSDMPLKRPLWFVHGLPGNRNVMRQEPNGDVAVSNERRWFSLQPSPRDSQRKGWDGDFLTLGFGFPPDEQRGGRELRDGYLPVLRSWWMDGPVYYEQQTVLDKLAPELGDIRLDDPTVLLMRVRVVNTSAAEKGSAKLTLTSRAARAEQLAAEGACVLSRSGGGNRLRYLIRTGGRGLLASAGDGLTWTLELDPGQSHELFFAIPSITLASQAELTAIRSRDFDADCRRICRFWEELTSRSLQIVTPEPWLNDFYKAHLRHLEVNCLRDLEAARRYAHVGTFSYGVFANESAMMVSDLDRRGCTTAAEQCLQTWLDFQGSAGLPGNFQSSEGVFYGAGGAEAGGYNKHHGYVMWCMAEHWRCTRDRKWMEQAAPRLVKACDWVIRERRATMNRNADGSLPLEYGFLPAGGLEDVQDYWHWLATNSATVWGFNALAGALADYGSPDGPRLQKDAKAYHDDVLRGLRESRVRAPVVRLRNGDYVPKFPSRLHQRGRASGWIRETLEGSLFLLTHRIIPPDGPEASWILKDYEDNLYISDRYGYSIPAFNQFWFSRGGFSMQSNLLDGPIPYLQRDEIRHFVRAYFNSFASAFYPEIRMCNEHCLPELGYPRGDHFKSSDEAQSTYWLRLMFVHEQEDVLYLGQALPRYWLADGNRIGVERSVSHFGPLSFHILSEANRGRIRAILEPPRRNPPRAICVRLRHPEAKPIRSVTLNGQSYDRFDKAKEWILLPGDLQGSQEVTAQY